MNWTIKSVPKSLLPKDIAETNCVDKYYDDIISELCRFHFA